VLSAVVACLLLTLGASLPVMGQDVRYNLLACRRANPRGDVSGAALDLSECGTRFTTQDRYVAVVVHLQTIRMATTVDAQLLDPEETTVWTRRARFDPEPGYYYTNAWVWAILPISADRSALARENLRLAMFVIEVQGKPVRERVGEWTFRASVGGLPARSLKFTLTPLPGAPSPTPIPSPTPSP
jgi:hypothetical protein